LKDLREFEIDIIQLKEKEYQYDFQVDDSFFKHFENDHFSKGNCKVKVILQKSSTMIVIELKIEGSVELTCDRTLEPFDHMIETDEKVIFKFGERYEELDDDIVIITKGTPSIHLAQYIFEFMYLTVPMKKIHPNLREEDESEDDEEEDLLIYSSSADEEDDDDDQDEIDPRWKDLKKLL
jgi:uncharacterized metal-binding protein YceD (DUF177 family)